MFNFSTTSTLKSVIAITMLTSLSGCGMFTTANKGEKAKQTEQGLTGQWRDGCTAEDWLGLTHKIVDIKFSALGDYDRSVTITSDEGCNVPFTTLVEHGTYASLDAASNVPDATNINFTVTAVAVTALTDDAVHALNAFSYCGITDWEKGKATDVLGKTCLDTSHPSGQVYFDIYQLSNANKRLILGKDSVFLDKSDAESRPTTLDGSRTFSRQ